jgi:hypothetical protein
MIWCKTYNFERKHKKGKNAEYKYQTEIAVEQKSVFVTVNVDLTIASTV